MSAITINIKTESMKTIALLFACAITTTCIAQDGKRKWTMPYATLSIGASFQEFDGLKSRIAAFPQYEQLKDRAGVIGVGWLKNHNNIITSGNINAGSSLSGDRDKKSSTVRFIGVSADLGYDVIPSDRLMLFPLIGIGYESYQARFHKDVSATNFNDVLNSPATQNNIRTVSFKNAFLTYRAGLGFWVKNPKDGTKAIGIQGGYTGSFKDHDWKTNDNQVLSNSPEDNLGRFFVSIVLSHQPRFMRN